jgi:hypothetical protein
LFVFGVFGAHVGGDLCCMTVCMSVLPHIKELLMTANLFIVPTHRSMYQQVETGCQEEAEVLLSARHKRPRSALEIPRQIFRFNDTSLSPT